MGWKHLLQCATCVRITAVMVVLLHTAQIAGVRLSLRSPGSRGEGDLGICRGEVGRKLTKDALRGFPGFDMECRVVNPGPVEWVV